MERANSTFSTVAINPTVLTKIPFEPADPEDEEDEQLSISELKQMLQEKQPSKGHAPVCMYDEESKLTSKLDYKGKVYKFDISKGRHNGHLLEEIIRTSAGRFKATTSKTTDFLWLGPSSKPEDIYEILKKDKNRIINRYPNVKDLCHKDKFKDMMQVISYVNPEVFEFVPPSFVFPHEEDLWREYANRKSNANVTYIAKPSKGTQGEGICLFRELSVVPEHIKEEMVVSRYISNPLLINGIKFDLRVYVVITGINEGDLHAFIADEGLARFCTEKYEKPTRENLKKSYMHLTNYSLNKMSEEYIKEADNIMAPNDGTKRTLAALYAHIEQEYGADQVDLLKANIKETCEGTLAMLLNMVQHQANP